MFGLRFRFHRVAFVVVAAVPVVMIACGDDSPTIPEISTLPDATTGDAPAGDSGSDAPTDGGIDAQPCDPPVLPDDAVGVFVSTAGANGATCGTRTSPCKTIATGVARAIAQSRPKVFVAQGQYDERVKLVAGIEVNGGWLVNGVTNAWSKVCGSNTSEVVVVRAPNTEPITVDAIDLGGEAKIADLRIESKPGQVGVSESIFGVFAVGSTTKLTVENVDIAIGNGGDGVDGKAGDAGADGGAGCVTASAGGAGTAGSPGAGATPGVFDTNGYSPHAGTDGTNGGTGQNGTAGSDGTCATCGTCTPVVCTLTADGTQQCGTKGSPGCAGLGGGLGTAATGGGSSVGLYCFNATVTVTGGKITAGNGGNGGNGGAGAAGGKGAPGAQGGASALACTSACAMPAAGVCTDVQTKGDGGFEGGIGGPGGVGGPGGGGAGGTSVAIYQGGAGIVTADQAAPPALAHGKAGKGGGPAAGPGAAGDAFDRFP